MVSFSSYTPDAIGVLSVEPKLIQSLSFGPSAQVCCFGSVADCPFRNHWEVQVVPLGTPMPSKKAYTRAVPLGRTGLLTLKGLTGFSWASLSGAKVTGPKSGWPAGLDSMVVLAVC